MCTFKWGHFEIYKITHLESELTVVRISSSFGGIGMPSTFLERGFFDGICPE
jgi:hypothetical protein